MGKQYGGYTVLAYVGKRVFKGGTMTQVWKVQCHCGKIKEIAASGLRRNPIGCGCTNPGKRKPDSFIRARMQKTQYGAKTRGYSFELTEAEYKALIVGLCSYCGASPIEKPKFHPECVSGRVPINGVDRVDNSKGYTVENCVTCCEVCNRMKLEMSKQEFLNQAAQIVRYSLGD